MIQLIAKLVIVILTFTSTEAAVCAVHFSLDNDTQYVHVDNSQDSSHSYDEASCGHLCHCAHSVGMFSHRNISILQSVNSFSFYNAKCYSSKKSPPLYRPPIVKS